MESTSVNNDDRISDGLRTHTQGNTGVYLRLAADFRNLQIETRIITAGEMFNWQHEPLPEHVEWRQRMCRGRWLMLLSVLSVLCMDAKPPWRAFTNRHLTCNQWSITQPRVWIFCLHIDVITAKVSHAALKLFDLGCDGGLLAGFHVSGHVESQLDPC